MKSIKHALLRTRYFALGLLMGYSSITSAANLDLASMPLFAATTQAPLVMLVMGRDHKLFYEAYNDASDLNGDGVLDIRYQPDTITYYGYFDSKKCYLYDSTNLRFNPSSVTTNKKCGGTNEWSGDFLNYVTTSRMDALRKVLYGGYRSTDTSALTVLERAYIPQDDHSWAKTYDPVYDLYDIRDYTPLGRPNTGGRHLFTSVTLTPTATDPAGTPPAGRPPLLRVLTNTTNTAQQWVSKERPVAGDDCMNGTCVSAPAGVGGTYAIVPTTFYTSLTRNTYRTFNRSYGNNSNFATYPNTAGDFQTLINNYADSTHLCGSGAATQINGTGNPYHANNCTDDNYLTIFKGTLRVPDTGTYQFAVDGDDSVEIKVGANILVGWYGGHGALGAGDDTHSNSIQLTAGTDYTIEYHHFELSGSDSYYLYYKRTDNLGDYGNVSTLTDYQVRVKVCDSTVGLEDNCKLYGTSSYKPTGLLHDYGENNAMRFGLLSGSYTKNTSGGVLRKKISTFTDEVNSADGTFTSLNGIVKTIDKMRIYGFAGGSGNYYYNLNCGWIETRSANEGECRPWGNPIGEMIYETIRYFAGKATPTSAFTYSGTDTSTDDYALGLPLATWEDPYAVYPKCCKPFELVISDVNPSYDTDQIPGSPWATGFSTDLTGAAAGFPTAADTIWTNEVGGTKNIFIGETSALSSSGPDPKSASSFKNIRGLSPEEPTKKGGFYSAAAAYWARTNDISAVDGVQNLDTFVVALASPLPRIEIPVGTSKITLVPFAKSVGGASIDATYGKYQPTNQIVDFYIDKIVNMPGYPSDATINGGRAWGSFQINYEDSEQGADHDMDAIAQYTFKLNTDNTVTVKMDSLYAAGGIIQHMGYVISGSTKDGVYLEVRDSDTTAGTDPDYYLDTPPGASPQTSGNTSTAWQDHADLPLSATRTFTAGSDGSADFLQSPLWYAAKWGGFTKASTTGQSDTIPVTAQWDADNNGTPDNYFLVTNALNLKTQIGNAFREIINRAGSSSTVAVNSGSLSTDTLLFQAQFNSTGWYGDLIAYPVDQNNHGGTLSTASSVWQAGNIIAAQNYDTGRKIITYNGSRGIPFRWPASWSSLSTTDMNTAEVNALLASSGLTASADKQAYGAKLVNWLRGDNSNTADFRSRNGHVLGDIVNSDPIYVGPPNRGYSDNWGTSAPENSVPYSSFVNSYANRTPVVYVGANDGMLHGINGSKSGGGAELIGYVPSTTYKNAPYLASTAFAATHRYLLDGSTAIEDVFYGAAWHTLLVGQAGAGGQVVYGLDVTNPTNFTEANANNIAKWEFTDAQDADLGYTYGRASVGRMQNGKWMVVVANGYNNTSADGTASTTGDAVLYFLDAQTGVLLKKIDTGYGMSKDPKGASRPNGLASPALVDIDGDNIIDYVYAGDLFGNLWKFDVRDNSESNWKSAVTVGATTTPAPFYSAKTVDTGGNAQPITSRPEIGAHPSRYNCKAGVADSLRNCSVIVYFGTGKYFENGDNTTTGQDNQTFYALADTHNNADRPTGRSQLVAQTISNETSLTYNGTTYNLRETSSNAVDWSAKKGWYIDLIYGTDNKGERQVTNSLLRNNRIIFTTLQPSTDVCSYGGSGWLMELDAFSGKPMDEAPFDVNGDAAYDSKDYTSSGKIPSGFQSSNGGIPSAPAVLSRAGTKDNDELKATSMSTGSITTMGENSGRLNSGRQTWRLIQ